MVPLGVIVAFVLFCFVGPHLYHSNQVQSDLESSNLAPGPGHPLGTDANGFDELGRIMLGGQASLEIAFLAAIATIIGTLYGASSGLAGGRVDGIMMRTVDVFLSIPFLLLVLIVSTKYHPSVLTLSLVLGIFTWFVPARLVRGGGPLARLADFHRGQPRHGRNVRPIGIWALHSQRAWCHRGERHISGGRRHHHLGFHGILEDFDSNCRWSVGGTCWGLPTLRCRTTLIGCTR